VPALWRAGLALVALSVLGTPPAWAGLFGPAKDDVVVEVLEQTACTEAKLDCCRRVCLRISNRAKGGTLTRTHLRVLGTAGATQHEFCPAEQPGCLISNLQSVRVVLPGASVRECFEGRFAQEGCAHHDVRTEVIEAAFR